MTLSTTESNQSFIGDGVLTDFAVTYKVLEETHLQVYLDNVLQSVGYSVTLNPDQDTTPGATVSFAVAPLDQVSVSVLRIVPLTQETDYQPFDAFPAESHETALDKLTMQTQQNAEALDRVPQLPVDTPLAGYDLGTPVPNEVIQYKSDGTGQESTGIDATTFNANEQAAAISAVAADASENKAQLWAEEAEDTPVEPGEFSAYHWAKKSEAAIAFDNYLKGYKSDGLHDELTGDLNVPTANGKYFIDGASVTNAPADFIAGNTGIIDVDTALDSDDISQILVAMTGPQANRSWIRSKVATVWGTWAPFGGGAPFIDDNPPSNLEADQRWWDSETGRSFIYYKDGTSNQWVEEDPAESGDNALDSVMVGSVNAFPANPPSPKWLYCNGQAVSRAAYPLLFAMLGVTYGSGDGSTTFTLPDYRGEFLRGQDDGAGIDPDAAGRADRGDGTTGDSVGTKQDDALQNITGALTPAPNRASINGGTGAFVAGGSVGRAQADGSGSISGEITFDASRVARTSTQTRPVNVNVRYYIYGV